jgi:hypothetical protein
MAVRSPQPSASQEARLSAWFTHVVGTKQFETKVPPLSTEQQPMAMLVLSNAQYLLVGQASKLVPVHTHALSKLLLALRRSSCSEIDVATDLQWDKPKEVNVACSLLKVTKAMASTSDKKNVKSKVIELSMFISIIQSEEARVTCCSRCLADSGSQLLFILTSVELRWPAPRMLQAA